MHGSTASVVHDGTGAFEGAPESMDVVRYNSLTLKGEGDLVSCRSSEEPMGLRSEDGRILSYQFHPNRSGIPTSTSSSPPSSRPKRMLEVRTEAGSNRGQGDANLQALFQYLPT